jgi:hypothetical protein
MRRLPHSLLSLALCFCFAGLLMSADSVSLYRPEKGAVVSGLSFLQRAVTLLPTAQLECLWNDKFFMADLNAAPGSSLPRGVEVVWTYSSTQPKPLFRVMVRPADGDDASWQVYEVAGKGGERQNAWLQNLLPGVKYSWKVQMLGEDKAVVCESAEQSFVVEDRLPRVLYRAGWSNLRDVGGMKAVNGKRVPFGKLYRCSAYKANLSVPREYSADPVIGEAPFYRTELDLRWKTEKPVRATDADPEQTQYLLIPSQMYSSVLNATGMENYRQLFPVFAKAENYPILFHCAVGADRTGTLAAMLQALLGCSRDDIRRDYVFTSFFTPRYFFVLDDFLYRLAEVSRAEDAPLQTQAEKFLLRCGIPSTEILAYQRIMLGEDYQPSETLQDARHSEELLRAFSGKTGVEFRQPDVVHQEMLQCGKTLDFAASAGTYLAPDFKGVNEKGEMLFRFRNTAQKLCAGSFHGEALSAPAYLLLEARKHQALLAPSGKNAWTPAELGTLITLPPDTDTFLLLIPAQSTDAAIPQEYTPVPWEPQTAERLTAPSDFPAPAIDGELQDEVWSSQQPIFLRTPAGHEDPAHLVVAKLATDPTHETLFLAVELTDDTPSAQERPRDGAVWEDDEVELFLSGTGIPEYYQIIINRKGSYLDGKGRDATWQLPIGLEVKTRETATGWTLEAAIPLRNFSLDAPLELNICATDFPANTQRNLSATYGSFHYREALLPVFLK